MPTPPTPVIKLIACLSQQNKYFYLNFLIFIAGIILTIPLFFHSSGTAVFLGYSQNYMLYLFLCTVPWILFLWLVLTKAPLFQKRLFFFLVLVFVALELSARVIVKLKPFQNKEYRKAQPYVMFTGEPNATFIDRAPVGAVRREEKLIKLNSLGFRGNLPSKHKPVNEYRIFMLGGSTVFNGSPLSKSIPGQVEQLFHADGHPNVKVYNWGVVSFVSGQELSLLLHTVIDYLPDAVIVYNGANDVYSPYAGDPRPGYPYNFLVMEAGLARIENTAPLTSLLASLLYKSYAVRLIYQRSLEHQMVPIGRVRKQIGNYMMPQWENAIISSYLKNVKKMCRLAQAYEFKLAVFLQPFVYDKSPHVRQEKQLAAMHRELKTYLIRQYKKLRVEFSNLNNHAKTWNPQTCSAIDLSYIFKSDSRELFWDIVHTNNAGNAVIAKQIYDSLLASVKRDLKKPAKTYELKHGNDSSRRQGSGNRL